MRTLLRGVALGLIFGFAAALADMGLMGVGIVTRRIGPGPLWVLQTGAMLTLLGALLGALWSPLVRLRFGRVLGLVALALSWLGLSDFARLDAPMGRMFVFVPAAGAFVLAGLGLLIARWKPAVSWTLAALLLATASVGPELYLRATTPPAPPRAELPPAPEGAPDVVLVVLDTVRAESVSALGYDRDTSPTLAALADEGTLFLDATSPSTWSMPSHASLFTGRYPTSHGAHGEHLFLDGRYPTLAQVLAANGYDTYCFTANAWISDGLGLTRGFAWQDGSWRSAGGAGRNFSFLYRLLDRLGLLSGGKGGGIVARNFGRWARGRPADARPAFVFLNFIEAHFPYHQLPREYLLRYTDESPRHLERISMTLLGQQFGGPGMDLAEARPPALAMYDGGVAYSDELLRRVVEALRARGTLDDTLLVVLADHGEIMGEKAGFFGHGPTLYQEVVHVPLLVRYPPRVPGGLRIETPVSTVGAFATILELADLEPPPTLQVGSLVPLLRGEGPAGGPVLSELMMPEAMGGTDRPPLDERNFSDRRYRAYRDGRWKLVESSKGDVYLYDLETDPTEQHDVAAEQREQLARMLAGLEAVRAAIDLPALDAELASGDAAPELDEATQERLRQLGYVE